MRLGAASAVCFCLSVLFAAPMRAFAMPVYGSDSRMDVYEERASAPSARWAASVAVFFDKSRVSDSGVLLLRSYGPSKNLAASERFYSQPSGGYCTGALIGPDLVLTAGHCVDQVQCGRSYLVFGFMLSSADRDLSRPDGKDVFRCAAVVHREYGRTPADDFAVIRLDRPAGRPALALSSRKPRLGQRLTVIGSPEGMPLKIDSGGKVRYVSERGFFSADLDVFPSNSGSPVLDAESGEILGVLIGGPLSDYAVGPDGKKRLQVIPEELLEDAPGELVLGASRIRELSSSAAVPAAPLKIKPPRPSAVLKPPQF